jgi:peptide deformylase
METTEYIKGRVIVYDLGSDEEYLKSIVEPFDFSNPPDDPIQFSYDLLSTMRHYRGIGLAANQVGKPYRVFAIDSYPALMCFNPQIIDFSKDNLIYLDEGCLSYPNLFIRIKRPAVIKVRYTEPNGNVKTAAFDGLTSRIFQHELDHLNGIIFYQRASLVDRQRAFKQRKIMNRRKK